MSRQQWYTLVGRKHEIESIVASDRLSEKTDDPEAKDYDEATEIFHNGVRLARSGDMNGGASQIACAYFLNSRSINFILAIPEEIDPTMKNLILDYGLLREMAMAGPDGLACSVMMIMLGQYIGSDPKEGQSYIAGAMKNIDKILKLIEKRPEIEDPDRGIIGGVLTRVNLLHHRSNFHMAMGDRKQALKDLTKALKIDEYFTEARVSRACLWAAMGLKDDRTIHEEFKRAAHESHRDYRGNDILYAWLAQTTLNDPLLGSIEDAKSYYEKSLQATIRRYEIYGRCGNNEVPQIIQIVHNRFQHHPKDLQNQRDMHNLIQSMRDNTVVQQEAKKDRHTCLTCGAARKADGGKCMKCFRCKLVSYCSKDCQVSDWKNHKTFCRVIQSEAKHVISSTTPTVSTKAFSNDDNSQEVDKGNAKKVDLTTWDANANASKRMELELRTVYKSYGKGFAEWWNRITFNEKKRLLLNVTNCSIPLKEPSFNEIRDKLSPYSSNQIVSRALFDYNVENLCGICDCNVNCDHYFNDSLAHEMDKWVNFTKQKEIDNIAISTKMKDSGIFPDLFDGKLVVVVPPKEKGEIIKYEPIILADDAPDDVIKRYKDWLKQGVVYDASALHYAMYRTLFSLSLLVRLFDEYQLRVRRQPTLNPMARLMGCGNCRESLCKGRSTKKCNTCKSAWFCSEQCMIEARHNHCPHGAEMASVCIFR